MQTSFFRISVNKSGIVDVDTVYIHRSKFPELFLERKEVKLRSLNCSEVVLLFRQEAIKQAERERRQKYRKQDEEREVIRSAIREKVDTHVHYVLILVSFSLDII